MSQTEITQAELTMSPRTHRRWGALAFLLIGGIINYFDRVNLSYAAPGMKSQLHLNNADIGLMLSVFSWIYAFGQLPSGWLIDRFGGKKIYSLSIFGWSIAIFITGALSRMASFLSMRVLLGIAEAPCFPTSAKITATWFPRKERTLATGVFDSSSKWGPFIAPLILVPILEAYGWRSLFYFTGGIGLIFAAIFAIFYRNPDKSRGISKKELAYIQADGAGVEENIQTSKISWGGLFKYRTMWGMILGYFCTIWIWNIFLLFLPSFLEHNYHVKLANLGFYSSIPWFGGIIGDIILSGYVVKVVVEKGIASPLNAKRRFISLYAILTGVFVILVPLVHSIAVSITLMTLALACISAITGSAWAMTADVGPQSMVASIGALQNFGGYFGGAFSPVIAGMIVDATGSYALAFISGGIIAALAAICYGIIVKKPMEEQPVSA